MMPTSTPRTFECNKCDREFDTYKSDFIQLAEEKFGNISECKTFLTTFKQNPIMDYNLCEVCLLSKWKNISKKITQESACSKPFDYKKITQESACSKLFDYKYIIMQILVVCIACAFGYYLSSLNSLAITNNGVVNNDILKSTFIKLKNRFPSLQHNLLKKISNAFNQLKSPGAPFIFLLLHDDTNKKYTDCLASYTSLVSKELIFTNTPKSLWMNASEWTHYADQDSQDLLNEKLIKPLRENEVLVLENLQDLPWSLAKSLHHLCDLQNPQIAKAMYILKLKVSGNNLQLLTDSDKLVTAELAMKIAWLEAPNSFREALITRLTLFVDAVLLKSDEGCPSNEALMIQSEGSFIKISP